MSREVGFSEDDWKVNGDWETSDDWGNKGTRTKNESKSTDVFEDEQLENVLLPNGGKKANKKNKQKVIDYEHLSDQELSEYLVKDDLSEKAPVATLNKNNYGDLLDPKRPKRVEDYFDEFNDADRQKEQTRKINKVSKKFGDRLAKAQGLNRIKSLLSLGDGQGVNKSKKKSKKRRKRMIKLLASGGVFTWIALILIVVNIMVVMFGGAVVVILASKEARQELKAQGMLGDDSLLNIDLDAGNVNDQTSKKEAAKPTGEQGKIGDGVIDTTAEYNDLLTMMAEREMGKGSSGRVAADLGDGGGANYGKYSFTQTWFMPPFMAWLKKNYPDIAKEIPGQIGSPEFNAAFTKYGAANEAKFWGVQSEYVVAVDILPFVEKIKASTGIDLNDGSYSKGLFSFLAQTMHWGPGYVGIWIDAVKGHKGDSNAIFDALYGPYTTQVSAGGYTPQLHQRWAESIPILKAQSEKVKVVAKT